MASQNSTRSWLLTGTWLLVIYTCAVALREFRLSDILANPLAPFWLESAMRYRVIQFIAHGQPIPIPDVQAQWPDGYNVLRDTPLQEYVIGLLARWVSPPHLGPFIRTLTPVLFCLIVLPVYWLGLEVTGKRWAALFGTALYVTLPATVDRSLGLVIYRENVMLPLLAGHVACLYAHFRRERGTGWIWLSGILLLLCHLSWKVTTFYQLLILAFLLLLLLWKTPGPRERSAVVALTLPPIVISLFFPVALHYDRYWGSFMSAASLGLLTLCLIASRRPQWTTDRWQRLLWIGLPTALFTRILPGAVSYGHAWDTVRAKLQFLGQKPELPSALNLHARHYWTGNYRSPRLAQALRDFLIPLAFIVMLVRRLQRKAPSLRRDGERWGLVFLTMGLLGSLAGYVMFRKFGTFLALFAAPTLALSALTIMEQAKHRYKLGVVFLALVLGTSGLTSLAGTGAEVLVNRPRHKEGGPGLVYDQSALNQVSQWLIHETRETDVMLGSWALSPFIASYIQRPVVLNTFFESEMVFRYEAFNLALFGPLEGLHQFAIQYEADYLILEANFLLRTDKWMSYRYVADALELTGQEALYRLHYHPEAVTGFEVAFQNEYFRIYRVLPAAEATPSTGPQVYAPLFDPLLPGAHPGVSIGVGETQLHAAIKAGMWVRLGAEDAAHGQIGQALKAYHRALEVCPTKLSAYRGAYALLLEAGNVGAAEQLETAAETFFHGQVVLGEQPRGGLR